MKKRQKIEITGAVFLILLLIAGCVSKPSPLLTELERSHYLGLTSSSEISGFLSELADRNRAAKKVILGESPLRSPVEALLISTDMSWFKGGPSPPDKMTVMLIGSQHGMEPSGAEALLLLSREILEEGLRSYLEDMNFIIIPNSNPDGRNSNRRVNGNGVNLSTNFTILSEPESRAIFNALHKWKPEVVLDVHESAVLKKKTLARQGFLIVFEAQFEAANNPNVDSQIRAFSFNRFLPEVIALVNAQGLPAQRYIGEITNIHQTITHGGLSLRNLRNMAGMKGSFSFLLENRLDPSTGTYPTPRNIRERVAKQYLCLSSFLSCCRRYRTEIINISQNARRQWKDRQKEDPLYLFFAYVPDENQPQITLPLQKLETAEPTTHTFRYNGVVTGKIPLPLPASYIITKPQELIKEFLDRHHIIYETAEQAAVVPAQKIAGQKTAMTGPYRDPLDYSSKDHLEEYTLHPGDLIISLNQPARRLIPLFLEYQSLGCIFNFPEYSKPAMEGTDFFIYRVPKFGLSPKELVDEKDSGGQGFQDSSDTK